MACSMLKTLNATSRAIHGINQCHGGISRESDTIDYLPLWHNHYHDEFKGICYLNLSDNYQLIENNI